MTNLSGKDGSASVAAVEVCITEWDINVRNAILETTGTCSDGNETFIAGINGADVNIKAYWDADAQATDNPPNMRPGEIVNCILTIGDSGKSFECDVIIETFKLTNDIKAVVNYEMSGKATGGVTFPT